MEISCGVLINGDVLVSTGMQRRSYATRQALDVKEAKTLNANDAYFGEVRLAA